MLKANYYTTTIPETVARKWYNIEQTPEFKQIQADQRELKEDIQSVGVPKSVRDRTFA